MIGLVLKIFNFLAFTGVGAVIRIIFLVASVALGVQLADDTVSDFIAQMATVGDFEIMGMDFPIGSMLAYMGVLAGIGIILGAYLITVAIGMSFKLLDANIPPQTGFPP